MTTVPGRRSGLRSFLLVAAFLAVQWIPIWQCWNCEGSGKLWLRDASTPIGHYALQACPECSGRGSIALLRKLARSSQRIGIVTSREKDAGAQDAFRRL